MKLSFSTLACPDWSFREVYAAAADLGYDGIEIRGIADEIYAPNIYNFSDAKIDSAKAHLTKRNLEIPMLTSNASVLDGGDFEACKKEVEDYCILAKKLGVPYVRVLMEKTPAPMIAPDFDYAVKKYRELCAVASDYGVTLLTETNGFLADSAVCARFMKCVDVPNAGLVWDVHHPYRFFGETPAQTVKNIGKYVKHVHLKDSVKGSNGRVTYMLTGYGDFPFEQVIDELKKLGYDGYLSYEWVKRWSRELAEPGVALYQYISYIGSLL